MLFLVQAAVTEVCDVCLCTAEVTFLESHLTLPYWEFQQAVFGSS